MVGVYGCVSVYGESGVYGDGVSVGAEGSYECACGEFDLGAVLVSFVSQLLLLSHPLTRFSQPPLGSRNSFFFFGGLSIHLSTALLAHLFSFNMAWGATKKEVERSNFFIEVPRILRRFWLAFVLSMVTLVGMGVLASGAVPPQWQVVGSSWAVILPLA
jgi:hypothetical protein